MNYILLQTSDEKLLEYMEALANVMDAILKENYSVGVKSWEYKTAMKEFNLAMNEYHRRYPYDTFKTLPK